MAKQKRQGERAAARGTGPPAGGAADETLRIADRLHSAAIHLLRRIRSADREAGLTPQRLSALSVVVFRGPLAMGDLAKAEQVSAPTMTRLVQGLERDGLVERTRDPSDERSTRVEATASGRRLLERGRRRRIEGLAALLEGLSPRELKMLGEAAELIDALARRSPGR